MSFIGLCILGMIGLWGWMIIANWRQENEQQRRRNLARKRKQVRKF